MINARDTVVTTGSVQGVIEKSGVNVRESNRKYVVSPFSSSRMDFIAHNNSYTNFKRALNERVFNVSDGMGGLVPCPKPVRGAWDRMRKYASEVATTVGKVAKLTLEGFINQCPANKRKLYERAALELTSRGWSSRDARLKSFIKFEKVKVTSSKPDPAPRIIQPRSPVYNIALGCYTRSVEHRIYNALATMWGVPESEGVVMKGKCVEGVAASIWTKWCRLSNPVAIGLDASRFDQHVSVDALMWEHGVYKTIFNHCPTLSALLKCQLKNKGFALFREARVSYTVDGTRSSGDMNTGLGNCLIMSCLVKCFCDERKINAQFVNNGDDCVLFINREDMVKLGGLNEWFLDFGFEMKQEDPVYEFEQVVFCQTQPVFVDGKPVMVRQLETALSKDAMALGVETELGFKQWCHAVGTGGLALYGDMPIFGELYSMYQREGVVSDIDKSLVVSDSGFMRMSKVRRAEYKPVSDATRVSFFRAFGVLPSTQIVIEEKLRKTHLGGIEYDVGVNSQLSIM